MTTTDSPESVEVVSVHGWGYSGEAWAPWSTVLPSRASSSAYDRGYFGRPNEVGWTSQGRTARRILLLHSMAPLFTPPELLAGADLVLLFGGFLRFHPGGSSTAARRSREGLGRMREELQRDPGKVLDAFRRRCGHPPVGSAIAGGGKGPPGREIIEPRTTAAIADRESTLDLPLLTMDLDRLDSEEVDWASLSCVPMVLILHGTDDRIVPSLRGAELADQLGGNASFFSIPGAGHALPFTHLEEVGRCLRPHLPAWRFR